MRTYRQYVEFANFICHFGGSPLLDYLDEIVLPAFLEGVRTRTYGTSRYILHSVKVVHLNSDVGDEKFPAIIGRFIHDTELVRDQILVDGKIIRSLDKLKSAPSSQFVLLLKNHKLLYTKEVANAPGLSAFATTVELLLKQRRAEYAHEIAQKNKEDRESNSEIPFISKKSVLDAIGIPSLEIVPLSGAGDLQQFVERFRLLKEIRIKVLKPNAEINNDGLFETIENARAKVNSTATTVVHSNNEGLNKEETLKQIAPAMEGNAVVVMKGTGPGDSKISGSNEEVQFKEPLDVPADLKRGAQAMLHSFTRALRSKAISISRTVLSQENQAKLARLTNDR